MKTVAKCLDEVPRVKNTAHSHIIEWLLEKIKEL